MKFLSWLRPSLSRSARFGHAVRWAGTRFPAPLQATAAYLACLLCEVVSVELSQIEPASRFIPDLRMDDLELPELYMALEKDLGIVVPDEDCLRLFTVAELVSYLNKRLHPDNPAV